MGGWMVVCLVVIDVRHNNERDLFGVKWRILASIVYTYVMIYLLPYI